MNKVVKETRYCKVLRQAKIRDNNVAYGIEKIFVKELNQEEIRFVYFKDTVRREEQLVARPLDLPEDDLIKLMKVSIGGLKNDDRVICGRYNIWNINF